MQQIGGKNSATGQNGNGRHAQKSIGCHGCHRFGAAARPAMREKYGPEQVAANRAQRHEVHCEAERTEAQRVGKPNRDSDGADQEMPAQEAQRRRGECEHCAGGQRGPMFGLLHQAREGFVLAGLYEQIGQNRHGQRDLREREKCPACCATWCSHNLT
jgi:hypothetical protein